MSHILLQTPAADERLRVWEANRGEWQAQEENCEAVLAPHH